MAIHVPQDSITWHMGHWYRKRDLRTCGFHKLLTRRGTPSSRNGTSATRSSAPWVPHTKRHDKRGIVLVWEFQEVTTRWPSGHTEPRDHADDITDIATVTPRSRAARATLVAASGAPPACVLVPQVSGCRPAAYRSEKSKMHARRGCHGESRWPGEVRKMQASATAS
jgi:hypothetical protein